VTSSRAAVLARARSAIGNGVVYVLGAGGRTPGSTSPAARITSEAGVAAGCDCSGFVAWCLGVDRYLPTWLPHYLGGEWFETTAVFRDAKSPYGFVSEVPWAAALPGDVIVYGDHRDAAGVTHEGHIGLVSEVTENGPVSVIHCSLGNFHKTGDAIQETDPSVFIAGKAVTAAVAWVTT